MKHSFTLRLKSKYVKKTIFSVLLVLCFEACNDKKTHLVATYVRDTFTQKNPSDTTKYDIILILGKAMSNLVYAMDTMKLTGDPDIDFSKIIQRHHRAGMNMSQAELEIGKKYLLKALAKKIINREQKEVASLNEFLHFHKPQYQTDYGKRAKEIMYKKPGEGLPMHGSIIDDDFTTMMLLHHQEGVNLSKEYLKYGKAPEIRNIAVEIVEKQSQEIEELKKIEKEKFR